MANKKAKERFKLIPTPWGCRFIDRELGALLDIDKQNNILTLQCSGDEVADAVLAIAALGHYAENEGKLYHCLR